MSDSFMKIFKVTVPKPRNVYKKLVQTCPEYKDLTYRKFKKSNVELEAISRYILNMHEEDDILTKKQLEVMFGYLGREIKGSAYKEIKNVFIDLNKLKLSVFEKINNLDEEKDINLIENLLLINNQIDVLKNVLISPLLIQDKNIEKKLEFEVLLDQLIDPDTYDDLNLITTLFENTGNFYSSNDNPRKFNDALRYNVRKYLSEGNMERIHYYKRLVNYLTQFNIISVDKKILCSLGLNSKGSREYSSKLDEKIQNMYKDSNTGKYLISDFVVTIDNKSTQNFDDAFSIEKTANNTYILGIHIADLTNSDIQICDFINSEKIAEIRRNSTLRENEPKPAVSLYLEISRDGFIIDKRMLFSKLTVNKNLLYDDFAKIITNKNSNKMYETLINLIGLYNVVKNDKLPQFPTASQMAHSIVHKYMLLYGCIVSDDAKKKNCPLLYVGVDGSSSYVTLEPIEYDCGFENYSSYSKLTKPMLDVQSVVNQKAYCECVLRDRIGAKKSMERTLILARDTVNNSKNNRQEE